MNNIDDIKRLNAQVEQQSRFLTDIRQNIEKVIIGQEHLVESLLIALLTDGHILLEGVPGLAKTLAIKSLASLFDAKFSRMQFTPDLLPADVIGTMVYSARNERFDVKKGPIFAHFVLADEVNRAPAKVQSSLLEAMEERQVTLGGQSFPLPSPFLVMATMNPLEQEGTYQLPEAQLDRFMLKVIVDYPSLDEEKKIIRQKMTDEDVSLVPVSDTGSILSAQRAVKRVYIDEKIEQYVADIVFSSRRPDDYKLGSLKSLISYGCSPRASINLALAGRTHAFIHQRGYVIPEDIRAVAKDVLRHRIGLTYEAEAENVKSDEIIDEMIKKVVVP